ncbi:thiolase family protein [Corynebacterium kozikiae]|uniref:thiolase family protein n=1 Tax=Corynebacterium kozikiae TaxID=2968469 RepID=UPI00211CE09D|nr:thiolase family protein [Corynebacterium sp. 76QC2CO]MCQ9343000.1 thiolase family protein [Corynebacterium sp. 76QC2CO]
MSNAYIVSALRTPVGRFGGSLSSVRADDLIAHNLKAVVEAADIPPEAIDDVIIGNANGAGEDSRNVARLAWLIAGFPNTVSGITVNRLCASGMSSIGLATALIQAGHADLIVAGGVESMSRGPWVIPKPEKAFPSPSAVWDTTIGPRFTNPTLPDTTNYSMLETAEEVAKVEGVSREDADAFAVESQRRALEAISQGRFVPEITPVTVTDRKNNSHVVDTDEGPREGVTVEGLAKLKPVVKGGSVVTAGNSSSLNDGASALIIASEEAIKRYGLTPRARIVDFANVGLAPEIMGMGPVPAVEKLYARTGWSNQTVDTFEINEAFATQSLASIRRLDLDPEKVNPWGGAIALGHPLGSSGSRITITLLNRMEQLGLSTGVSTMCVGFGQGMALALERV